MLQIIGEYTKNNQMLKNSLLLYFLIAFFPKMFAQNLNLYDFDDKVVSNDTVYFEGNTNDNLLEIGFKITNSGTSAINVKVKKEEISIIDGTENYFCWKECYTPDIFVSPDFLTIEAGATNDRSFKGDYKPNQNNGESEILYTFFNVDDTQDTVSVLVIYDITTPTAITSVKNNSIFISKPYPVPAKEFVSIKFNLDKADGVKLEIFSLQGSKIEEKLIEQRKGEFVLFSGNYDPGIYIYQFSKSGRIIDKGKFIFQ